MAEKANVSFKEDFRQAFFRGLSALLPTVVTIAILVWAVKFLNEKIGRHIQAFIKWIYLQVTGNRLLIQENSWQDWLLVLGSFLLAVVVVYFVGYFLASFAGRAAWKIIESILLRIPIIKQLYPAIKQITEFFFKEKKLDARRVVLVEYPRKGIWSLGLVTGEGMKTAAATVGKDVLTVFIPSSPTPVTGYVITVPRDEVIDLNITLDEALRFTVSGGVIVPSAQMLPQRNDSPPKARLPQQHRSQ